MEQSKLAFSLRLYQWFTGWRKPADVKQSMPAVGPLVIRATTAMRVRNYKAAAWLLAEAGAAAHWSPDALNLLGLLAEAQGDWKHARTCWTRALTLNPTASAPYENLARYYELFQFGCSAKPVAFGDGQNSASIRRAG